jgi:dTMP kinase
VRPALERGAFVLADRFDLSTRAYQIAGRGLPEAEVLAANRLATGGLVPDLVVVLDLAPATGRERQRTQGKVRDRMEMEDDAFHLRVAEAFRAAAGGMIVHLDGGQPPEEIHRQLWTVLTQRFASAVAPAAGARSTRQRMGA